MLGMEPAKCETRITFLVIMSLYQVQGLLERNAAGRDWCQILSLACLAHLWADGMETQSPKAQSWVYLVYSHSHADKRFALPG